MAVEPSVSKPTVKIVTTDKAFKLAQSWMSKMTGASDKEDDYKEMEARPPSLGLGAAILPSAKRGISNDPVERKLLAQVIAKKKQLKDTEQEVAHESNDDEDEPESRTMAFVKKRPLPSTPFLPGKKKK